MLIPAHARLLTAIPVNREVFTSLKGMITKN